VPLPRIGVVIVTMGTRPQELDALLESPARQESYGWQTSRRAAPGR
jgi:hypothetical protein